MVGCTLDVDETSTTVYQEMRHGDGSVAAAFRTRLLHVDATSLKPFPWNARTRAALEEREHVEHAGAVGPRDEFVHVLTRLAQGGEPAGQDQVVTRLAQLEGLPLRRHEVLAEDVEVLDLQLAARAEDHSVVVAMVVVPEAPAGIEVEHHDGDLHRVRVARVTAVAVHGRLEFVLGRRL
ncbi:MAG: hypothetical protein ABGW95_02225 [Candidatus Poseidoniia archaeon]